MIGPVAVSLHEDDQLSLQIGILVFVFLKFLTTSSVIDQTLGFAAFSYITKMQQPK